MKKDGISPHNITSYLSRVRNFCFPPSPPETGSGIGIGGSIFRGDSVSRRTTLPSPPLRKPLYEEKEEQQRVGDTWGGGERRRNNVPFPLHPKTEEEEGEKQNRNSSSSSSSSPDRIFHSPGGTHDGFPLDPIEERFFLNLLPGGDRCRVAINFLANPLTFFVYHRRTDVFIE